MLTMQIVFSCCPITLSISFCYLISIDDFVLNLNDAAACKIWRIQLFIFLGVAD